MADVRFPVTEEPVTDVRHWGWPAPIFAAPGFVVQSIDTVQKRTDWLGTARARAGVTITPSFLLYVTGGLAYGGVRSSTLTSSALVPVTPVEVFSGTFGSYAQTRVGYTIGGGGEWTFAPNWSLKAEYLYYNLGSANYNAGLSNNSVGLGAFAGTLSFQDALRTRVKFDGHIARVGVNYHFNWGEAAPVVARY
jgi:outer membrane immunogenic protein